MILGKFSNYAPVLTWAKFYNRRTFSNDLIAALIVTIMLVPQSLAYALLAGLPPQMGLYASIVPIILYAVFGSSKTLAVGPVAVVSLMTATALGTVVQTTGVDYIDAALTLAAISGVILLLLGLLKLGFLANFLSHPVISGFITATAIIIAAGQLKNILGFDATGHNLIAIMQSLVTGIDNLHGTTALLGVSTCLFLFWSRRHMKLFLISIGIRTTFATVAARTGPVFAIVATTLLVWWLQLDSTGVKIVGSVPSSLPPLTSPSFSLPLVEALLIPAFLISVIGFVESVSVAQTLAAKKRQRIDPDQELIALGAANVGAAFSGGFPVTGGFSRSIVNYDAGAETPAAGAFTALILAIVSVSLSPLIYFLPKATLGATIIVAVLSLIDFKILKVAWAYSKADFLAVLITMMITLGLGVELGVSAGVVISILLFLHKTARPHIAEVGLVPGTQHFRNIHRHDVITYPAILSLRIDESLFFANARFLEDHLFKRIAENHEIKHVVLMCSAVNEIDMSALETLESIKQTLEDLSITLHMSEVKGPVMDRLTRSHFIEDLTGQIFLSQFDSIQALAQSADNREPAV